MPPILELADILPPAGLYLSAGCDPKPLSFLSPAFLDSRNAPVEAAPVSLVYVDRVVPVDRPLAFHDDQTEIRTTEIRPCLVLGFQAADLAISVRDNRGDIRTLRVIRVRCAGEDFVPAMRGVCWTPDIRGGSIQPSTGGSIQPSAIALDLPDGAEEASGQGADGGPALGRGSDCQFACGARQGDIGSVCAVPAAAA